MCVLDSLSSLLNHTDPVVKSAGPYPSAPASEADPGRYFDLHSVHSNLLSPESSHKMHKMH